MKIQQEVVTVIEIKNLKGISKKTNNAYDFYSMEFADSDFNKFQVTVPGSVLEEGKLPDFLTEAAAHQTKVVVDLRLEGSTRADMKLNCENIEEIAD